MTAASLAGVRLVVVDRSPEFLRSVERFAQSCGAQVVAAHATFAEALVRLDELAPDAILLEWPPGDAEAPMLVRFVRLRAPRPVQVALLLGDERDRSSALEAGVDAVVEKEQIAERLAPLLAGLAKH